MSKDATYQMRPFEIQEADSPVIGVALHNGHDLRPEVEEIMMLADAERRREEDPLTAEWIQITTDRVRVRRSRFEVDLNRPRERAVYRTPADAWGLEIWKQPPSDALVQRSLAVYDVFYAALQDFLEAKLRQFPFLVVLDMHTYNHRRGGPEADVEPEDENPEFNVGTGTMDRERWADVVDPFLEGLRGSLIRAAYPDVRENVKFQGGEMSSWIHHTFPERVCSLAVEVKKTFMDEWSGTADLAHVREVQEALLATVPGLVSALERRAERSGVS